MESVGIAFEVYLIGFVVAIFIAGLIKGLLGVIKRITPKSKTIEE